MRFSLHPVDPLRAAEGEFIAMWPSGRHLLSLLGSHFPRRGEHWTRRDDRLFKMACNGALRVGEARPVARVNPDHTEADRSGTLAVLEESTGVQSRNRIRVFDWRVLWSTWEAWG
jgi:hypothetical protein